MFMKMNNMVNNFSVVIPVFNEEEIFLDSANKIYKFCKEMNIPFEIIFCENGSFDNTVNLIQTFWWKKTKNIGLVKKLENLKYLLRKNIQPRLAWEITFLKISIEDI